MKHKFHEQDLKPDEAYEPGFGKYTLSENQLSAGTIARKKSKSTTNKTAHEQSASKATDVSSRNLDTGDLTRLDSEELRNENTNLHNNW